MWDDDDYVDAPALRANANDYVDEALKEKIKTDLIDHSCIVLTSSEHIAEPYLEEIVISKRYKYNPNFGDNRTCKCGHPYHRHFDSYENNAAVGCKYCSCGTFEEKVE
jgi:hypothetical protein